MSLRRRDFIKGVAGGGLLLLGGTGEALAREHKTLGDQALGLLYDSTKCIGCKACVAGCKQANDRPPEHTSPDGLWDDPIDLSADTWNIIKMHREGDKFWFIKRQCMHCVDPACVSACPVGALQKQPDTGIVTYNKGACIGCRYCQVACPFLIPKFEWNKPFPVIAKCNLCLTSRLEKGGEPGCTTACPTGAVIFGKTRDLLAEARGRIKGEPGRYVDHIYGETEAGGTQVLYLSAIPFETLGLPALGPDSPAAFSEGIQHGIYKYMAAPVVVFGALSYLTWRNLRKDQVKEKGKESKGGK
jgi:Fe-S-cluster-containing dehydrogenase component